MAFIERYITGEDETYEKEISSTITIGQSFTVGTTGGNFGSLVDSIDVKFNSSLGSGSYELNIYEADPEGLPTGPSLSTGTITASSISSLSWARAQMSGYTLQPSTQYILTIGRESGSSVSGGVRADGTSPSYAGGNTLYLDTNGTGVWTNVTDTDLLFQVNGGSIEQTMATVGDVIGKAGANANSTALSPILITNWIKLAESKLNLLTRKNWTDIYSSLNEDVKFAINDAVSTFAAIYVINYGEANDGFTLESQRKVENLRVLGNELVRELKDLDIQEFVTNA